MLVTLYRASLILGLLLVACGGDAERSQVMPTGNTPTPPPVGGCLEGQIRDCSITLSIQKGYTDCLAGKQRCISNTWADCVPLGSFDAGAGSDGAAEAEPVSGADAGSD